MKKFLRKAVIAMLTLAMAGSMAACAGSNTSSTASKTESKAEASSAQVSSEAQPVDYKDTKFSVVWWGSDARTEQTTKIVEEFEKAYKNLKVEVSFAGYGDYFTMLTTKAASNELPDVMQMDFAKVFTFADNNQLLALDDLIQNKTIDFTNVSDAFVSGGIINDKMYGVTCGINAYCMFYNTKLLKDNNITVKTDLTWPEFLDTAKQVYEKTGVKTYISWSFARYYEMYARSLGGNLVDESGKKVGFTAEMLADLWGYYLDAIEGGLYASAGRLFR